jgi:putative transposase
MNTSSVNYKRHRFPPQIIAHAVWLYYRFPLSLRLVEEMLLERGIVVSYETIRRWGIKFGPDYAHRLRRKKASRNDVWHLDEVVVTIAGRKHWLWRAIDQDGHVLDEIVQNRRNTKAAKRVLMRLCRAEAHGYRQAALLWGSQATGDAGRRASVAQGVEQPGGECPCAAAKTGADHARLPITRKPPTLRLDLLGAAQSLRPAQLKRLCRKLFGRRIMAWDAPQLWRSTQCSRAAISTSR